MNIRPILPDPTAFMRAGLTTLSQAAILVHIGRCGLNGTTVPSISEELGIGYNTALSVVDLLKEKKLIVRYGRQHRQGGARLWVVTRRGWETLTTPADTSLFPDAIHALATA